jgi:hypothetical protein
MQISDAQHQDLPEKVLTGDFPSDWSWLITKTDLRSPEVEGSPRLKK